MSPRRVAIVGASGSGKSWLAQALNSALLAHGHSVLLSEIPGASPPDTNDGPTLLTVDWWITEASMPFTASLPGLTTLLMGLDLPGLGLQHQKEDNSLRQALTLSQTPFRIVYGAGIHRLNNALLALGLTDVNTAPWQDRERSQFNINGGRDTWVCNDCSDPACEHKLFTRLLTQRAV
jgi:energy-coupling factor transporter ATP-binding protein EcfA2